VEGVGDVEGGHVLGADWRHTCTSRVMGGRCVHVTTS
jgi:hypothetical protein